MDIHLERIRLDKNGTYGVLISDHPIAVTIEKPWKNNQHIISCIPSGVYKCKRFDSPHFGPNMWLLDNVPDRSLILIHYGNFTQNSNGCILLGSSFADVNEDKIMDIASSKLAYNNFMLLTRDEKELTLTINEIWPSVEKMTV